MKTLATKSTFLKLPSLLLFLAATTASANQMGPEPRHESNGFVMTNDFRPLVVHVQDFKGDLFPETKPIREHILQSAMDKALERSPRLGIVEWKYNKSPYQDLRNTVCIDVVDWKKERNGKHKFRIVAKYYDGNGNLHPIGSIKRHDGKMWKHTNFDQMQSAKMTLVQTFRETLRQIEGIERMRV